MSIAIPPPSHVFAYGTLMFSEVWRLVTGRDERGVPGRLDGHAVFRVRDAVYPGMVWTGGASTVPGVVYLNVDEAAIQRLDEFEDAFYERREVSAVFADGAKCQCCAYVVPAHRQQLLTREPWTPERFSACGDLARFLNRYPGFTRLRERPRHLIT